MIQRDTKVDAEVILSVSIPVLAVCTGASSLFTSTLFTTQNIASAALYCTFIAALAVLGWWLLSCAFAIRYLYRIRSGLTQIVNRDERGTLLLPRFMRNAVLTLGGISLGLGAVLSPAQAAQQTETASQRIRPSPCRNASHHHSHSKHCGGGENGAHPLLPAHQAANRPNTQPILWWRNRNTTCTASISSARQ